MTLHPIVPDPTVREALVNQTKTLAANDVRRETGETADGPATAALLAGEITNGALRHLGNGVDPFELERGLRVAHDIAVDALRHLAQASPEEAMVPGAGFVYVRALAILELEEPHFFEDVREGVHLLRFALEEPARELARKLGLPPDEVISKMREGHGAIGLDPATGELVDLAHAGVMTPTRVVQAVLDAAVSSVVSLLRVLAQAARIDRCNEPKGRMRPWP